MAPSDMFDQYSIVVKRLRQRLGISQRELARRAGLSSATISRLESGVVTNQTTSTISSIAAGLGVTDDYLLAQVVELSPMETVRRDPVVRKLVLNFERLSPKNRDLLTEFLTFLEQKEAREQSGQTGEAPEPNQSGEGR